MEDLVAELKSYVRFDAKDEAALSAFAQHAEPHFDAIVQTLYERIEAHPAARALIASPEQRLRLEGTLREWLSHLLRGPRDEAHFAGRWNIGRMHAEVGLPQRYTIGAMNVIRAELQRLAASVPASTPKRPNGEAARLTRALDKALDIELALTLEAHDREVECVERNTPAADLSLREARYDEIVERAGALITTLDARGRILLFNAECEHLTGAQRDSIVGARWVDVFVSANDRTLVQELHARALSERTPQQYEGPLHTEHGERLVRWYFTRLPEGEALCAIGIDVTREHERAVRTRRAERLAALGTLAGGFAHEIRNPLNSAKLQLSVARRRLKSTSTPPGDAQQAVELAEQEMQRLAAVVEDFLMFARPHALQLVELDLRRLVSDVLSFLEPEARAAGVSLQRLASEPLTLEIDATLMKQVLLNLVRNAIEASAPGGQVRVSVQRDGRSARLAVEDDGAGFALDAPIFEPFYTTKETGTGLGLAIAHRIVMDHAGNLEASTEPGRTEFVVTLPISRTRSAPPRSRTHRTFKPRPAAVGEQRGNHSNHHPVR